MAEFKVVPKGTEEEPPQPGAAKAENLKKPKPLAIGQEKKLPLQFKVSEDLFEEFSRLAAEQFGHKKGSKLELFLAMYESYKKKA